jgi:hypothetical protein
VILNRPKDIAIKETSALMHMMSMMSGLKMFGREGLIGKLIRLRNALTSVNRKIALIFITRVKGEGMKGSFSIEEFLVGMLSVQDNLTLASARKETAADFPTLKMN